MNGHELHKFRKAPIVLFYVIGYKISITGVTNLSIDVNFVVIILGTNKFGEYHNPEE